MALDVELKSALDQLQGETKTIFTDLATKYGQLKSDHQTLQLQVDAIDLAGRDVHRGGGGYDPTWKSVLEANEDVAKLLRDRKGSVILTLKGEQTQLLERKTTILNSVVGAQTTGVLQIDRIPGIVAEARQELFVRDALTATPTNLAVVDFVKVVLPMTKASPQVEASDKGENRTTFTSSSEQIRTLATWIPASRQVLDDMAELANFLDGSLRYAVLKEEERQMLAGDGTGQNLHGLIPQATAFDTSLLIASAGWTTIDIVGRAVQQVQEAAELMPTFLIVHPRNWWGMRLTKNSQGNYILGDPQGAVNRQALFGLVPIVTTNISSGTFLVGSGSPVAAEIRDRMEMQVEISTSHSDFFSKNLLAIRAEKRTAIVVKRPASYITGSFTTSPA